MLSVPQVVHWYLDHAMSSRPVRLELIKGTTLWLPSGSRQEVNAANGAMISSGSQIRTVANSEAFLSLLDGSNVRLWPDTTLSIVKSATTTYNTANSEIVLDQENGHARYEVALPATESRQFELHTPQADVLLRQGSYKVQIENGETIVTVSAGSATVSAHDHAVEALRGEWVKVPNGGEPTKPESSIHNLIPNGDFSEGWKDWQPGNRQVEDGIPGSATIAEASNRSFVEFLRTGSDKHAETYIHTTLNQDVTDEQTLKLTFQIRIQQQTLSGGGILGSEYPLIARVHYRDSAGNEEDWMRGFYIQNTDDHPTPNAEKVIANQWTDESFNLFDSQVISPRPAQILWIEIAASGHGYQSDVARIQLLAD